MKTINWEKTPLLSVITFECPVREYFLIIDSKYIWRYKDGEKESYMPLKEIMNAYNNNTALHIPGKETIAKEYMEAFKRTKGCLKRCGII